MKKNYHIQPDTMTFPPVISKFLFGLFLFLYSGEIHAQRLSSFFFSKLPQDYQLYPRDSFNEAYIPVAGTTEATGYSHVSMEVYRNDSLVRYINMPVKYDTKGTGTFATETKIKAELAEYHFKIYAHTPKDSALIVHRKNVVSGDLYIISGQSNSIGFFTETETSEFCRTFGKITDNNNTDNYNPADTLWALSNQNNYANSVGSMGLEIQKQLSRQSGIPNCLINAGFHWSTAESHARRTENNPADLTNGYGRMLYRIQKSGLLQYAKSFIFRQGESEAYHEGFFWAENFAKLRNNLKTDLPNLEKIYVFQIDIIFYPSAAGAEVRDHQRRLPDIYPDVTSIATVGTKGFDGLHYEREGYIQNGQEISRIIAKDFYQGADTLNINSPTIKKVFYKSDEKKEVVMVFDEGQEMVYPEKYNPNANVSLDMKDFIYMDERSWHVSTGSANMNRINLTLYNPADATLMSYLPMYLVEGGSYYPYTGPYLTNKRGMRALSFFNFPISEALKTPSLTAILTPDGNVSLTWQKINDATEYVIERKLDNDNDYSLLLKCDSSILSFIDTNPSPGHVHGYRIRAFSFASESTDFGFSEVEVPIILSSGIQENLFSAFPNPAQRGSSVTLKLLRPGTGSVRLISLSGALIKSQDFDSRQEIYFKLPDLPSGHYVIEVRSAGSVLHKKLFMD